VAPSDRFFSGRIVPDLERRREAVAEALRAVMAERRYPEGNQPEPIECHATGSVETDDDVEERASVPPFEPAGTMSPTASRVLFGDR
jgi:hypothetical protein